MNDTVSIPASSPSRGPQYRDQVPDLQFQLDDQERIALMRVAKWMRISAGVSLCLAAGLFVVGAVMVAAALVGGEETWHEPLSTCIASLFPMGFGTILMNAGNRLSGVRHEGREFQAVCLGVNGLARLYEIQGWMLLCGILFFGIFPLVGALVVGLLS